MAPDVFRHLVVPTDFSDCAEEAWGLAQRVAQKLGSEIVLIHVFVEPPVYGDPPGVVAVVQVLVEVEKWVADELEKWAAEARKRGITARTVVRRGSPPREIVALASEEHADVVIMGTHGRGGVSRALLGSVADRVIRTAPCPVLTVRKPEQGEANARSIRDPRR
jgi:nucleotide-binding universal stress UspA family protein